MGDLSDEDLTVMASLVDQILRRGTRIKREYSHDGQLELMMVDLLALAGIA